MKVEIIKLIKILGVSYNEIVIEIDLSEFKINTIELVDDDVVVHIFSHGMDTEVLFDDLLEIDQTHIYRELSSLVYN